MSDFIPSDFLPDLWEEILKRHWTFLDTEEGQQKIDERLKLEACLKQFLCVVPHDRKFFLPETAFVLRQSIREIEDFTANNGIIGFETVSQYANNLFTKPWRKEFRVLKMYAGTFQHEIEVNLAQAVKLFEAMGYRRLSDETLVLDGPICPDQVTNVSRDAMAAYVECKIMKQISMGLAAMDLKCSLRDIFNYREKHTGGVSQTVQGLAYILQERRHRKDKISCENSYATLQRSVPAPPVAPISPQCPNCLSHYHNMTSAANPMHFQHQCPMQQSNQIQSTCAIHQPNKMNAPRNSGGNDKLYSPCPPSQMTHSRSLEHYNEPPALLPHRHSFDHQQQGCTAHQGHYQIPRSRAQYAQHLYESPYDCIDGGDDSLEDSSASYAAVANPNSSLNAATYAHPYNVSGNRYPLPYNISNQLNSHYSTPCTVTCNGVKGSVDPYDTAAVENVYATVSKPQTHNWNNQNFQYQQVLGPSRGNTNAMNRNANPIKDLHNTYRQGVFSPERLIDFDDRAPLTAHDYHENQHAQANRQYNEIYFDHTKRQPNHHLCASHTNGRNSMFADQRDILSEQNALMMGPTTSSDDAYGSNIYARAVPRSMRPNDASMLGQQTKHMTDKYIRKMDNVQDYDDNKRKMPMELSYRGEKLNSTSKRKTSNHTNDCGGGGGGSDLSYESGNFDDFVTVGHSEHPQRLSMQSSKNQDGVGSFESWDYVFQNLEQSGYTKDLGERGDLLVQSLDLDSMNITTGGGGGGGGVGSPAQHNEKRRSTTANHTADMKVTNGNGNGNRQQMSGGEKAKTLEKISFTDKNEMKTTKQEKPSILKQTNSSSTNNIKKTKPISTSSTVKPAMINHINVDHSKSNGSVVIEKKLARQISGNGGGSANVSVGGKTKSTTTRSKPTPPIATQVIVSSPNEWSCRFCTFLNPDTKRICEMCSRSKDFNLEAVVSNAPTCV